MQTLRLAFATRAERITASVAIVSGFVGLGFILHDAFKIAGGL